MCISVTEKRCNIDFSKESCIQEATWPSFFINQLGTSIHKIVILHNKSVEKTDQIYVAQN